MLSVGQPLSPRSLESFTRKAAPDFLNFEASIPPDQGRMQVQKGRDSTHRASAHLPEVPSFSESMTAH